MTQHETRGRASARRFTQAVLAMVCVASASPLAAQATKAASSTVTPADREDVRRAVLDYVEGFYEGDSTKLARSIRPEVYKYGFWKARDSTRYAGEHMTWPEFFSYARGIREKNRQAPATAPKRIELLDVQDQTASAKLTAFWGTDYLLLGKYDGKWMISSVMWQSLPLKPLRPAGGDDGGGGAAQETAVEPFEPDLLATDNVFRGTFARAGRQREGFGGNEIV
ncbi:MAG TPA: nuclear transport factor 2 family protein [Gemmatimonadaceae bacterium]|nr:nuclear transport factor 2 family protein [Gemmatimonadaceae bacterium]